MARSYEISNSNEYTMIGSDRRSDTHRLFFSDRRHCRTLNKSQYRNIVVLLQKN